MRKKIKSLFSEKDLILNSGLVFGAGFIGALFMFVSNIILSRIFGPEDFGSYKVILSLFLFLPALVDFGASSTLIKYVAEFRARKEDDKINCMIRFFLKIKGFFLIAMVLMIWLFKDLFAQIFLKDPSLSYLILPGLVLSLFILVELSKPIIAGFQNFRLFSISDFLTTASIGVFTVVLGYFYGIYYAILGCSLGYLVGNAPNIWYIARGKFLSRKKTKLDILPILKKYSAPMWGTYLLNRSNMLIIPVLSLFFAQKLIGYYGFAWTFYSGIILIPMALSLVLFPKISELHGTENTEKARTTLRKVLVLYTPIVLIGITGTLLFSEQVVSLVAPAYLPGLLMFKALMCFCLIFGYIQIYRSYLSAKAEVKKVAVWTLIQNIALLAFSFVIIGMI